eukprot:Skav225484  [mRNA]  locus=scaffold868:9643:21671:- [translate_table: standard]
MLCGYPPFYGESDQEVLDEVRQGKVKFQAADWTLRKKRKNVSEDAKALIKNLLQMSPKERYTAEQALNDVWIKEKAPKAKDDAFVDKLRGFLSQNKLKNLGLCNPKMFKEVQVAKGRKAALQVIASSLDDKQIQALRETFQALDENGDGLLTAAELRAGSLAEVLASDDVAGKFHKALGRAEGASRANRAALVPSRLPDEHVNRKAPKMNNFYCSDRDQDAIDFCKSAFLQDNTLNLEHLISEKRSGLDYGVTARKPDTEKLTTNRLVKDPDCDCLGHVVFFQLRNTICISFLALEQEPGNSTEGDNFDEMLVCRTKEFFQTAIHMCKPESLRG